MTELECLSLDGTKVGDAGVEYLKGLAELQRLWLGGTKVSDAGLEHLKGLTKLNVLDLRSAEVSDAGLEHLKGFTQLQCLCLSGTQVTDHGLMKTPAGIAYLPDTAVGVGVPFLPLATATVLSWATSPAARCCTMNLATRNPDAHRP